MGKQDLHPSETIRSLDPLACGPHQIIENQAVRTLNAPALVMASGQLTHGRVNARANQLSVYAQLLAHLAEFRAQDKTWIALRLIGEGDSWHIEGKSNERACLAWAIREGDGPRYEIASGCRVN